MGRVELLLLLLLFPFPIGGDDGASWSFVESFAGWVEDPGVGVEEGEGFDGVVDLFSEKEERSRIEIFLRDLFQDDPWAAPAEESREEAEEAEEEEEEALGSSKGKEPEEDDEEEEENEEYLVEMNDPLTAGGPPDDFPPLT